MTLRRHDWKGQRSKEGNMTSTEFADDWITKGWSKINGQWIELGHSASVTASGEGTPAQVGLHDVAGRLNKLETALAVLRSSRKAFEEHRCGTGSCMCCRAMADIDVVLLGEKHHSEAENTAALMVKVLAANGDTWRIATCEELAAGFKELTKDEGPWRRWFNNPFVKIDLHDLVDRGFAEWHGPKAIAFTEKGLGRMAKWVTREEKANGND
jgi:hypothetical protein